MNQNDVTVTDNREPETVLDQVHSTAYWKFRWALREMELVSQVLDFGVQCWLREVKMTIIIIV